MTDEEMNTAVEESLQRFRTDLRAGLCEAVETLLRDEQGLRDLPDDQQLEMLDSILGKHLRYNREFRKNYIRRQRRFQKRFKK